MKKILSLATATVLLFTACAQTPAEQQETESQAESVLTSESEPIQEEEKEPYPYELKDLGGYDFVVLNGEDNIWEGTFRVIDFEEATGEAYSDAIFNRARLAEDDLNFTLTVVKTEDLFGIYNLLIKDVASGSNYYKAAYALIASTPYPLLGEAGLNLYDIPELHLDEPWWNQTFIESATLFGNLLYSSIDYVNMNSYAYLNAVYCNNDMMNILNLELPYDIVRSGNWTYDKMYEYIEAAVNIKSDTSFDPVTSSECIYGYAGQHEECVYALLNGSGEFTVIRDSDGYPVVNQNLEALTSAYSKILSMFSQDGYFHMNNDGPPTSGNAMFIANRAMFLEGKIGVSGDIFRELEFMYSVLPVPKAFDYQENYYSPLSQHTHTLTVSKALADPSAAGMIIDYMSFLGLRDVIPELQTHLCYKGLRDEDSIDMFNIILDSACIDFGYMYGWSTMMMDSASKNLALGKDNFASTIQKVSKIVNNNINKSLDTLVP